MCRLAEKPEIKALPSSPKKEVSQAKINRSFKKRPALLRRLKPTTMRLQGILGHPKTAFDAASYIHSNTSLPDTSFLDIDLTQFSDAEICRMATEVATNPAVRGNYLFKLILSLHRGHTIPKDVSKASLATRACMLQAALGEKDAWIFTLRLGEMDIKRALLQSSLSFSAEVARQIKYQLKKRGMGDTEYWFLVEAVPNTRALHIHGGFSATVDGVEAVKESLMAVAKGYRQRWNNRALDIQRPLHRFAWANYSAKDSEYTRSVYGECLGGLWKASPGVKRRSNEHYRILKALLDSNI